MFGLKDCQVQDSGEWLKASATCGALQLDQLLSQFFNRFFVQHTTPSPAPASIVSGSGEIRRHCEMSAEDC